MRNASEERSVDVPCMSGDSSMPKEAMGSRKFSSRALLCRNSQNKTKPKLGLGAAVPTKTKAIRVTHRRRRTRETQRIVLLLFISLLVTLVQASSRRSQNHNEHLPITTLRTNRKFPESYFYNKTPRKLDEGEREEEGDQQDEKDNDNENGQQQQQQEEDDPEETEETQESSKTDDDYIDDFHNVDDYYAFEDDPPPPSLMPLSVYDVIGFLLVSMGVTLAAGGGIGGGGILVPVFILIFEFPPRAAIPLSAITVMGGAAAATLHNSRKRHPLADRPIIDWDLVLVMEPLILVGAIVGTGLHIALSEKVLVVLLVVFLSVTAHATLTRARKMFRAENQYMDKLIARRAELEARRQEAEHRQQEASKKKKELLPHTLLPEDEKHITILNGPWNPNYTSEQESTLPSKEQLLILNPDYVSTLRSDLLEQEKVAPRSKILAIVGLFSVYVFLEIMIGGGSFDSPWGIRCGGPAFWSVHAILVACLIASAFAAQTYLVNRHEIKELVEFDFVHGDIRWDSRTSIVYPFMFGFAGLFAGMFGIGGGMVTVPLLFTMGVHPMVATATSSAMTFFTSFGASVSFAIFGLYLWDYAVACMLVGFFASLFGQKVMRRARRVGSNGNFERTSMIAFSIGGLILMSAFLMTVQYLYQIFVGYEENDVGGLCEGYRYHRVA